MIGESATEYRDRLYLIGEGNSRVNMPINIFQFAIDVIRFVSLKRRNLEVIISPRTSITNSD